jgi:hypothetical protein
MCGGLGTYGGELTAVLGIGDALTHCRTGERLAVLAHSAEELVLEDLWPAAHYVPEHRHPRMSEHWRLLEVVERLFGGEDPGVLLRIYPDEFAVG